ncbi:hypothetical protein BaRGS_00009301 [Batillaria attramentaria]|uniref:Uncharacterized protein n=1 Tax=Batillaria attramentaria TaxID=370345 RepID=A0ABD0LJ62_9CAEN
MNNTFTYDQLVEAVYQGGQSNPGFFPPPPPQHFTAGMHQPPYPGTFLAGVAPPNTFSHQQSFYPGHNFPPDNLQAQNFHHPFGNMAQHYQGAGSSRYSQDNFPQGNRQHSFQQHPSERGHLGPPSDAGYRGRGRGSHQSRGQGRGRGAAQFRSATFTRGHPQQYNSASRQRRDQPAANAPSGESGDLLYSQASHRNYRAADSHRDSQRGGDSGSSTQRNMFVRKVDRYHARDNASDLTRSENASGEQSPSRNANFDKTSTGNARDMSSQGRRGYSAPASKSKDGRPGGQGQGSAGGVNSSRKQFLQNNFNRRSQGRGAPEAENEDEGSQRGMNDLQNLSSVQLYV